MLEKKEKEKINIKEINKMSKLMKQYQEFKKEDPDSIYIFQVGIFYNILNEDARIVSNKIGLN